MTPVLNAAANRLMPLLGRIGERAGSFLGPTMRFNQIQVPGIPPLMEEGGPTASARPSVPISTGSSPEPAPGSNGYFNDAFSPFPNAMKPPPMHPKTVDMESLPWPQGPVGAPQPQVAQAPALPHQPIFGGPQLPAAAPEAMSAWQRNAFLQKDGLTGDYIDPSNAARADATGPELIQKMMGYFHRKERA